MEDGRARRRLQFCDEPYKNKSFYIDVKTKSMHNRVSSAVTQLGGTVESFLSKDIFIFVTDAKTSRLQQNCSSKQNHNVDSATTSTDISLSNYSPANGTESQNFPGVGGGNISMMSRGRALLMKARENRKDNKSTNTSTDGVNSLTNSAVMKAFQMGIKIEHAINFLRKCKSVGVSFKPGKKSKNEDLSGFTPLVWDDKNFIKYEDMSKQYRPIFKQLENIPTLHTENYGGSPFDGPTFLQKVQTETTGRKEMKGRKFTNEKGGYCEMCALWFTKTLKDHMHSSVHLSFVKNKDNFSTLDTLVSQLPTVGEFLAKFIHNTDHSVDDSDHDQSLSDVKIVHKLDPSVTIHECMNGLKLEHFDSQTSTCLDAKEKSFPNEKHFPLQVFTDGKLFANDVLNIEQNSNMFSSDHSQSESPTTILKDLLSNWTLQDSTKPTKSVEVPSSEKILDPEITPNHPTVEDVIPVLKCVSVLSNEEYSGTTCSYMCSSTGMPELTPENIEPDVPMSLGTPILSLGCQEDTSASDCGQLKLRMVYGNGEPVPSAYLPINFPKKGRKRKLRKVKHKNKENNVYCSHKTSETKLKLSKIVLTPLQQKCNLKMFWQVRKTGDCKLVFSSRKRKNVGGDFHRHDIDGEHEEQGHRFKKQRLVF